jgi:hypothetical protein
MNESEMIDFVKAIAETERLRIVGLLTQKPAHLCEINNVLGFHPSDTHHHLDQLVQSGVVRVRDGLYELDTKALEKLSRRQFEGEQPVYSPKQDLEKNTRQILKAHLNPDGTIKIIPVQPAKLRVILEYLVSAFASGANYSEKEVNLILAHFHPDTSALRRYLIDAGMLERERNGSRYWRPK